MTNLNKYLEIVLSNYKESGKLIKLILQSDITPYIKKLHPATQYKLSKKRHPRMTQAIFAELMGVDEVTVRRWISGGIPKTKIFIEILKVLEESPLD